MIDAWKNSADVQYTKAGNPKPPAVEVVAGWVKRAWKAVPDSVIHKSIAGAGFSPNYEDWHIARHDVYGSVFRQRWLEGAEVSATGVDEDDVLDDFDELMIDDDVVDL
ncbi:hypothetical protein P43SY_009303 [Pythium insidiosum]|uniref:DDE-1 domain-containing protein n=1 Tax=Pythium insidiosum TaxID=114742 RepID=A0AAD5LYA9_PYTIN|nr:hypothetical protein P43SY_009303 [Pythium insidiosum]